MTFKEKLKMERPDLVNDEMFTGGCFGCPADRGYEHRRQGLCHTVTNAGRGEMLCTACWNRTIPGSVKDGFKPDVVLVDEWNPIRWPKKNPHLTEHAKAKIKEKIYLDPRDVDVLERLISESTLCYIQQDLRNAYDLQKAIYKMSLNSIYGAPKAYIPDIKKVIFNDPATIVIWADGEKTVVKCQNGEPYDPEKGLAMAISKRALGNKHEYYNTFKHWLKKYNPNGKALTIDISCVGVSAAEAVENIEKNIKKLRTTRGVI